MEIFFSYSQHDQVQAAEIQKNLKKFNVLLKIHTEEVKYTQDYVEFMKSTRRTDFVLMLISDAFLRSMNCMYEVTEFMKDDNFTARLLPIVHNLELSGENTVSIDARYLKHWQNERDVRLEQLRQIGDDASDATSLQSELKICKDIVRHIGDFVNALKARRYFEFLKMTPEDYLGIITKVKFSDEIELKNLEALIYDTRLHKEIDIWNKRRVDILTNGRLENRFKELISRRFKFAINKEIDPLIEQYFVDTSILTGTEEPGSAEQINEISQIALGQGNELLERFIREENEVSALIYAHGLLRLLKRGGKIDPEKIRPVLLGGELPDYKMEAIPEIIRLSKDQSLYDAVEKYLRNSIEKISGRSQVEVWALFCRLLRQFNEKKFKTLFILSHYIFLRFRSDETQPYMFPLLLLHENIQYDDEDYSQLLKGNPKEKMAAVWTLSFYGGIIPFLANVNQSTVKLDELARNNLLSLSAEDLDYRDKWRLCGAAVEVHLLELLPWLMVQAKERDMLNNTVAINHPTYDLVYEPQSAMLIRTIGYFALLNQENRNEKAAQKAEDYLLEWYNSKTSSLNISIKISLATALGYLGHWKPSLEVLSEEVLYFHHTVKNVVRNWLDKEERPKCMDYIRKKLEFDLSPRVKRTLEEIYKEFNHSLPQKGSSMKPSLALSNKKDQVQEYIAAGNIPGALNTLLNSDNNDVKNRALLLSSAYNRIQRDIGLIDYSVYSIECNRITNSLIDILDDLMK